MLDSAKHVRDVVVDARQQVYGADREAEREERKKEIAAGLNASQEQRRINITRETATILGLAAPLFWAGVSWGESFLGKANMGNAISTGAWAELGATAAAIGLGVAAPTIEEIREKVEKHREKRIAKKQAESEGDSSVSEAHPAEERNE